MKKQIHWKQAVSLCHNVTIYINILQKYKQYSQTITHNIVLIIYTHSCSKKKNLKLLYNILKSYLKYKQYSSFFLHICWLICEILLQYKNIKNNSIQRILSCEMYYTYTICLK